MDGFDALWDDPESHCEYLVLSFRCPGSLNRSGKVLLQCQVYVDPIMLPGCCFFVEMSRAISECLTLLSA